VCDESLKGVQTLRFMFEFLQKKDAVKEKVQINFVVSKIIVSSWSECYNYFRKMDFLMML